MTKDELIQRRERARPRIIHAWQRRNPNVRIRQMTYHNPNYYITSDGRVYCLRAEDYKHQRGEIILALVRQKKNNRAGAFGGGAHNYLEVSIPLSKDAFMRKRMLYPNTKASSPHIPVHRLVARYFCNQEFFDRTEVDHLDGNPKNNNDYNLEWVTPEENRRRAVAMRRARKREKEININRKN